MKKCLMLGYLCLFVTLTGCTATAVGGGVAGAYKVGTDERSAGRMWDDSVITAKIKAELVKDPATKARKIDVDTLEGDVILTGVVESAQEAEHAVGIAKGAPGVICNRG